MRHESNNESGVLVVEPTVEAILIPGGGLTDDGVPHPWSMERLDWALAYPGQPVLVCLSGYSPHKAPPRDAYGQPITEACGAANYLLSRGCEPGRILTEWSSFDTIGNAFFARIQHVEPRGWSRLLVVTSEFHLPRTRAVFETVLGLPNHHGERWTCQFAGTANRGLSGDILRLREEKEARALAGWRRQVANGAWRTLADFHQWLWTRHECYAPGLVPVREAGGVTGSY